MKTGTVSVTAASGTVWKGSAAAPGKVAAAWDLSMRTATASATAMLPEDGGMTAPDGEEAAGEAITGDNTDEVLLCGAKKRSTGQWNGILTPFGGSV